MRRTLRATRKNPIDRDATAELLAYVKKEGGFLRVEYTSASGKKVTALLRPEGVGTRDGRTFLVGYDFRDVNDQPMGLDPKERRSIDITKIDTMAYRAEKDVDPIVTGLGGAFAFLNWRYPIPGGISLKDTSFSNIHEALQKIAFEPEETEVPRGRKSGVEKLVIKSSWEDPETGGPSASAVKVVDKLLSLKFANPTLRRWLVTTGTRPFFLDPVPENAPDSLQVDQNPILERLRAEALGAGVQPATPLPQRPSVEEGTSIISAEGLEKAQAALDSLRATTTQRKYWAEMHRDPDTPELVAVAVEDFRRDSRPDVDAVIYIQSIRDSSNTPDKVFALLDPPIPYLVLKQPANLLDESGAGRALKWIAEHPDWQRIGIAMVTTDISRKQITPETLLYRDMLKAGLVDPEMRGAAAAKVEFRYTNDGNIKSPISGEVVAVRPGAAGYQVTVAVPAPLQRGIGALVHVTTTALNAVLLELSTIEQHVKELREADNSLKRTAAFAEIGAAWEQLQRKIERLRSDLLPRLESADRRREVIGGTAAPINAVKQELLDLKDAKDAVMACLTVFSDYVRLLRRLQDNKFAPLERGWDKVVDRHVRDMNLRLAKINRQIERIPPELRSDSRTDNLRGLAKLYPGATPGAKYEFVGDELYLYEYLTFPSGREPLNLKPGQLIWAGDTIILGGKRTDVAAPRSDKFAVTDCYVIAQVRGINCAPVNVSHLKFPSRITDRDELATALEDAYGTHVNILRFDALWALGGENEEMLKKISAKLTAEGKPNFIEDCEKPEFVVDPVFYCILYDAQTGDVWLPPMGSIIPGPRGTPEHNEFIKTVLFSGAFGLALIDEALAKTVPFMSDIPLDVNKPKLLWHPKGEYSTAIRKILVERTKAVQTPGFFEYEKNYFPSSKAARIAKKEGEELSSRLVTMGTYRALGTAGAVLGAEGKMYASKSAELKAPLSGAAPSVSALTYGKREAEIVPQKYAAAAKEGGGLTIVGSRGGKGAAIQQLRMAPAMSRFDRYMEELVKLQAEIDPTARQIAMAKSRAEKEKRENAETREKETEEMITRTNPDPPRRRRTLGSMIEEEAEAKPPEPESTPESAGEAKAPKAAAAARAAGLFTTVIGVEGESREFAQAAQAISNQRNKVQESWAAFNDALRGKPRKSAEELKPILSEYLGQLGKLETLLSARDAAVLQKKGFEGLQAQLRHESAEWSEAARAPYSQPSRDDTRSVSQAQRVRFVKDLAGMVDAFGRPMVPPSDDEMRVHGLPPLDLSVTAVKPGTFARSLKRPLDYPMLVKAAEIAAAAAKERPSGISASAVSCRVMGDSSDIKSVAYTLARDTEGGQYHQLLFRRFGASAEVQKFKTVLLWFAPTGDHVIFYVNGFPTCEFHIQVNAQHPQGDNIGLLVSVLRYTEDWFNDPREYEKRKAYRVLLGQSGSPRLYQIWGPAKFSPGSKKDVGTFSAPAALERIFDYHIANEDGVLSDPSKVKAGVVKNWVTVELAGSYGTTPDTILKGEQNAYIRALAKHYGRTAPRSFSMLAGGAAALRKGMESQAANEVTAALAKDRNSYTLYYPPLYSEEGVMDRTTNEATAAELKAQLDWFAKNVQDNSEFTIIDGSLFRVGTLKSSIEDFNNYRIDQVFVSREVDGGSEFVVVPPYRYLRDQLTKAGKKAKIIVVCPLPDSIREDEELAEKMDYLTANQGIVFKPAATGGAAASLRKDFAHGSGLVIWNDPDTPNATKFFGLSRGIEDVATLVVDNLGLLRRIVVESSGYSKEIKEKVPVRVASRLKPEGVEAEIKTARNFTLPQMIREVAVLVLAQKIETGVSTGATLASVVGLPSEMVIAAQAAAGTSDPRAVAEAMINTVAEAYKVEPTRYFEYGYRFAYAEDMDTARERRLRGFGETPTRENRNRTREQVASRFFFR